MKKISKYNNFLPKIIASFQDYEHLYLIIDYFEGNNLYSFKNMIFSENQIKFISACIIQSLSYLRKEEIINRDVRMKNLVMDKDRYLNLIDFSFSISYSEKNDYNLFFVISPLESPPETRTFSNYDYNSDYYRIGVIIYYLIFKKYINQVKEDNNISEIKIEYNNITNYSSSCIDFLNKLIITDYKKRIGFKNISELKEHSWFKGFNWNKFEKKKLESPLIFISKNKALCRLFPNEKKKIIPKLNKKLIEEYNFVNKLIIIKILKSIKDKKK